LFDAQAGSRHLDLAARYLRAEGPGFYTIGSAGHEADAAVGAVLRPSDPALLHYRSGAFYLARAAQVPGSEPLRDVLLGLAGASDEPIAGGRHKVFGHHDLAVIPQTSTIASHLPRAVGIAFSIGRAAKLGVPSAWPADAITVASFGDASASHSTATGAINAACRTAYQGLPMPLLLVCEDNGLGISVRTPDGWVAAAHSGRPALRYFSADGSDPAACFEADEAVTHRRLASRAEVTGPLAPRHPDQVAHRKSSTWPTCTTPKTSSAARRLADEAQLEILRHRVDQLELRLASNGARHQTRPP
jgi:2-oxoisovalerate dehydrogenase E1 component